MLPHVLPSLVWSIGSLLGIRSEVPSLWSVGRAWAAATLDLCWPFQTLGCRGGLCSLDPFRSLLAISHLSHLSPLPLPHLGFWICMVCHCSGKLHEPVIEALTIYWVVWASVYWFPTDQGWNVTILISMPGSAFCRPISRWALNPGMGNFHPLWHQDTDTSFWLPVISHVSILAPLLPSSQTHKGNMKENNANIQISVERRDKDNGYSKDTCLLFLLLPPSRIVQLYWENP